jgi:CRP/FNR family cyclic AMP-dependent transcriptional regulator
MLHFRDRQSEHPRLELIRQLGLFANLNLKELRIVDRLLHQRHYLNGEIVFDRGEEGQGLYIVLSGRVLICQQGDPVKGRIAEVMTGVAFGELALLDGAPRSAQARAVDDCSLALLSRTDFNELLETHALIASKIAIQLARQLGQKLREHYLTMDARPL